MFFTYVLYSKSFDRIYIGQTKNLSNHLESHNLGRVKSTKAYSPWILIYHESFSSRSEAMKREKHADALFKTEEKIRIVLEGIKGETLIAELCRREGMLKIILQGCICCMSILTEFQGFKNCYF